MSKPNEEQIRYVEELACCGMDAQEIARALGITVKVLRKHYADAITNGPARRRAEVIRLMFHKARSGSFSAMRQIEAIARVPAAQQALNERVQASVKESAKKAVREYPMGKREAAQQAATQVTGVFQPPPPPKLVVNN